MLLEILLFLTNPISQKIAMILLTLFKGSLTSPLATTSKTIEE